MNNYSPIKTGAPHPFYNTDPRSWNDPYKRPSLKSLPGPVSHAPPCKKYAQDPDSSTWHYLPGLTFLPQVPACRASTVAVTQAARVIAVSDVPNVFVDEDSKPTYSRVLNTSHHHHHLQWHL